MKMFKFQYKVPPVNNEVLVHLKNIQGTEPHYKIGIGCFSTRHTVLRSKIKDWLAQNQNNVSEWSGMYFRRLLFQ